MTSTEMMEMFYWSSEMKTQVSILSCSTDNCELTCVFITRFINMLYFVSELEINGEIYGTKDVENPKAYFSNFAIFYKDMEVMIDRTGKKIVSTAKLIRR